MMRVLCLLCALTAGTATAEVVEVTSGDTIARFEGPTDRYGHAIMGNLPEWSRLCLSDAEQEMCVQLPETAVFEDIAPRLHDLDGDGRKEAVVVESTTSGGAALAVYGFGPQELVRTATEPIGQRNRWLAPIGVADFDQNGRLDIAYVETPHLGKILKIVEWQDGRLSLIAKASGFSNHRIGDEFITSGIRSCGTLPEIVIPGGAWQAIYSVWLDGGTFKARKEGPVEPGRLDKELRC